MRDKDGTGVQTCALPICLKEDRPEDADPGLKAVLDQIDLRAAVELAKAGMNRNAG